MRLLALALLATLVVAGLWISTQYVASALYYQPELGAPWTVLHGTPIYTPWAWLVWNDHWGSRFPVIFRNASGISSVGAVLGVFAVALVSAAGGRRRDASTAHGSARWATKKELKRAGLLLNRGIVLCQTDDATYKTKVDRSGAPATTLRRHGDLVCHDGPEHAICFAPTRSGKGVGLVIPTLFRWTESVIVYDIKKENWALTAGWRKQFSRVLRFEPTAPDSVRFNPLLEIRPGLCEVKDAQNVADILVDPTGERETKDHWQSSAHALLVGVILHVLYAEPDKTLAGVARFLADPSRSQAETLGRLLSTAHTSQGPHPVVAQAARAALNKSENERSGVFSTALGCLGLYLDPVVARATSASDFRIADLVTGGSPASLYIVVPPSDLSRTRPIVRLVLNQIARRLTETLEGAGQAVQRRPLLLLLDEFPSLGRLDFFETSLAFLAGYQIKALLIAQSLNQLEKAHGPHTSILDNCHVRLTYAANDDRTARRVSDLLGMATETKKVTSYSGSGFWLSHRSESQQEFGRALLTPSEVMQLPADDAILLVSGLPPYRARKVRYYLDRDFRGFDKLPPPNSPEEQARELIQHGRSPWDGRLAAPPQPPPVATPATDPTTTTAPMGGPREPSSAVTPSTPASPSEAPEARPVAAHGATATEDADADTTAPSSTPNGKALPL